EFLASLRQAGNVTERLAKAYNIPPAQAVNWRWHMKHQITRPEDCPPELIGISGEEKTAFAELAAVFTSGITPYYAALMNPDPGSACPVRLQGMPSTRELFDPTG